MTEPPEKKERRGEAARQKLAQLSYGLFSFVSNLTGSVFWWAEQKKWKLADQIEQLAGDDWHVPDDQFLIDHESRISSER